jgi:hypothetical protein
VVLLIHDDPGSIAALERVLAPDGRKVKVATTVALAVAAFRAERPSVILLAPEVESGRGHVVLEELVFHPQLRGVPVLLLGEGAPGFNHPVAPMPPTEALLEQVQALSPPRSARLLEGAERALHQARADAAESRAAQQRSHTELSAELEIARGELERERGESAGLEEARRELEERLKGLQREHDQTQGALARISRERAEAARSAEQQLTVLRDSSARLTAALDAERAARTATEARVQQLDQERVALEASADRGGEANRAELSAAAAKLEEQLGRARKQLETARESHRIEVATLKAGHDEELETTRADLSGQLAELQVQLDSTRAAARVALEAAQAETDHERRSRASAVKALEQRLADSRAELEEAHDTHRRERQAATRGLEERLGSARAELEAARSETRGALERAASQSRGELTTLATEREAERAAAQGALDAMRAAVDAARAEHLAERSAAQAERAEGERVRAELAVLRGELDAARAQLASEKSAAQAERHRAEAAQVRQAQAEERIQLLESRTHLVAANAPEAAPLAIPRGGALAMGELARLMVQLWRVRADVRVDLILSGGLRRLWLRRGALVAAWSSLEDEGLTARARKDGLIDGRQQAELREVRDASAASLLEELRQRGLVRKSEVSGLVKRYAEEIALEALSEAVCTYRLHDEPPGVEVPLAEDVRPLPAIVAQALKRSLPWEAQLELLGGPQAVPRTTGASLDLEVLGFNERERALIAAVDGATGVESLIIASGLKNERGYQALAVAKLIGVIAAGDVQAPLTGDNAATDALEAKYEQVQQTDYFAILGLPRTAGADEVKQARARLARQFDPLKWSGHPDPALLRRAQAVFASIDEAGRTLQDDRLRAEYARHLVE